MGNKLTDFDWISGFVKSTYESIPEVIGVTPSTDTINWRQDHPVSGVVSEFAGMAVPYGGWLYGALKIPRTAKAIAKIGDMVNKPISTGVKRELAIFAPFEAGRVGASQVLGDTGFNEEVGNSVLNLALGSGISGLVSGVAAAGLRDPALPTIFPGLDIAAPAALQARHMKGILDSGRLTAEWQPRANLAYKTALKEARKEELPEKFKYVTPLMGDPVSHPPIKGLDQLLNRWFRPTNLPATKALQSRAFSNAADKNFATAENWMNEADFIGIGKDDWAKGQYFRSISFNTGKPGNMPATVHNKITKGFEQVGDNWYLTREADDGMFVMAKKYVGNATKADPADKWLLFKTDQPGAFLPDNQRWADAMIATHKWLPETPPKDGGLVYNSLANFTKEIPFRNYQVAMQHPKLMQMVIDKLGPIGDNELAQRLKEQFRAIFTPRQFQFTKVPRANWISTNSKVAYDQADNVTNELMNGAVNIDPGKSAFFTHISKAGGPLGTDPLRGTLEKLKAVPEEWDNIFANFIRPGKVTEENIAAAHVAGDLSDDGAAALRSLLAIDNFTTTNVTLAENAAGRRPTKWLPGHGGWSHVWEGDTRIPINNEAGALVFLAAGPNKRAAQKAAEEVLAANPSWKLGQAYSKNDVITAMLNKTEIDESIKPAVLSPSWILERSGVGGYKWHNKTPTIDDFLTDYENGLRSRWRYQANIATDELLTPQLNRLQRESPAAFKQVTDRMNADAGLQGTWGRQINKAVDEYLAPVIGNESATKIVGITNTTLMNFHLGAMNLAYPAVNLLTFIQTTLPEVAMVLGAMPDRLAPYYSHFLAGGTRGPVGAMAVLQPLRIAGQALKVMAKPTDDVAEALSWAYNNRTLDPRMVEEYIGASTTKVKDIVRVGKGLAEGKGISPDFNFTSWLRAFSEWLPANSERMGRTHTFLMGYITARDLLRKNGKVLDRKEMLNFAKQFTEKTMYMYSAADKPRVLTSPVGSGLGLFKNWMFNYIGAMGQYSKEAFLKGNFAPLAWQTAGTFAMGGLSSTPIYWAADVFSKAFSGNDALATAYDMFGAEDNWFNPADGVMYGFPAMLSGVSFYSQVQAPGANPTRDAVSLFNSVVWDRAAAMWASGNAAFDYWQATGKHPGHDQNVRLQMAKAFMPSTIYRTMATTTDGDILSGTTGYPMVKNMSFYERTLYKLKLNPVDLDKAISVSNRLYSQREERRAAVAQLGEAFTNAQIKGDGAEMALVMRQAMVWGIDTSSVLKSAMSRLLKHQESMIDRGYRPQDIAVYQSVLED